MAAGSVQPAPYLYYRRFAWFTLAYCVAVILWGAYVRATGSGAGCGAHWPSCQGEIIPHTESAKTLIEYSHRVSSGLSLVLVTALFAWTFAAFPRTARFQRRAATCAFVAILLEALIGAMLVLLRLVEHDQSIDRAISISLHLENTLFLLGSLTIVAMAPVESTARWLWPEEKKRRWVWALLLGFGLLGALGAMAALGDTLFPVTSLSDEMRAKFAGKRHFLQEIRLFHPLLAIIWAGFVWAWLADVLERLPALGRRGRFFLWFLAGNLILGLCNVLLLAPLWMQILHLWWAETLWILLVSLVFSAASRWQ